MRPQGPGAAKKSRVELHFLVDQDGERPPCKMGCGLLAAPGRGSTGAGFSLMEVFPTKCLRADVEYWNYVKPEPGRSGNSSDVSDSAQSCFQSRKAVSRF